MRIIRSVVNVILLILAPLPLVLMFYTNLLHDLYTNDHAVRDYVSGDRWLFSDPLE